MKPLRVLLGYPHYPSEYHDVRRVKLDTIARLREAGYDIRGFCLTLDPPAHCLSFLELDQMWKRGDPRLLRMYERLEEALGSCDVLINEVGINLHPEFVAQLPVFTVFQCFDDPESSSMLSRPAAGAYDLALVGNIAEVETYRSWGVKRVEWTPIGLAPAMYDSGLTYKEVLYGERDIELFMMVDRLMPQRKERLDRLASAFPQGYFFGRGWPRGYLPQEQEISMLRRAQVGPNMHLSTGPINYRTFTLPANGVLQVCDNKSHLGRIFALGREVVGFDTLEECIDLCRYYIAHQDEARQIAAEGWKRCMSDYTEVAVFRRTLRLIEQYRAEVEARPAVSSLALKQHRETRLARLRHRTIGAARLPLRAARKLARLAVHQARRTP